MCTYRQDSKQCKDFQWIQRDSHTRIHHPGLYRMHSCHMVMSIVPDIHWCHDTLHHLDPWCIHDDRHTDSFDHCLWCIPRSLDMDSSHYTDVFVPSDYRLYQSRFLFRSKYWAKEKNVSMCLRLFGTWFDMLFAVFLFPDCLLYSHTLLVFSSRVKITAARSTADNRRWWDSKIGKSITGEGEKMDARENNRKRLSGEREVWVRRKWMDWEGKWLQN